MLYLGKWTRDRLSEPHSEARMRKGIFNTVAAAAAKSLQSCLTLCNPKDGTVTKRLSQCRSSFFKHCIYFVLGYSWLTNNVVTVSGEQQGDSAINIHVSILPQTPLPSRLPHSIEQSSMCLYSRSLLIVHLKYNNVYLSIPNSLTIPSPDPSPQKP